MNAMAQMIWFLRNIRRSTFAEIFRLLWKDRLARMAMLYLFLFFLAALLSFIWTPYDYRAQDLAATRQGPSWSHWFGTDLIGRDMFTRVLYAARITSLLLLMTAFLGGLPLSITLGLVSGYYGNRKKLGIWRFRVGLDNLIMHIGYLFIGVPPLLFILLLTATARPRYDSFLFALGGPAEWLVKTGMADLFLILLVTSLIFWVGGARLYRSQVLSLRESRVVESARMLGASDARVISKHILPYLYPFIVRGAAAMFMGVIGTEIALSFFGIGIRAPHPSFGAMFSETASVRILRSTPHLLLIPAAIIIPFLFSIGFIEMRLSRILASPHEREGSIRVTAKRGVLEGSGE